MESIGNKFVKNIQNARELRNKNLNCFEYSFKILCILLIIFGLAFLISGINFIQKDLWSNGQFGLDQVKMSVAFLIMA